MISSAQVRICCEVAGQLGLDHRDRAEDDFAGAAVDGDVVALVDDESSAVKVRASMSI